jgi:hypothetical protein
MEFEKECCYMQPIDELVLSSLGSVLLSRYPPFSSARRESVTKSKKVKKLHIRKLHPAMIHVRNKSAFPEIDKFLVDLQEFFT